LFNSLVVLFVAVFHCIYAHEFLVSFKIKNSIKELCMRVKIKLSVIVVAAEVIVEVLSDAILIIFIN